jgi:hypothetical protein
MKRFWLVLLSLGLVLAFSASAFAVDVKFSGSFYAAGMYLDKVTLRDNGAATAPGGYDASASTSTAFYYQRLRVQTDFIVSPGLKLVTRFDALERIWGGARSAVNTATVDSAGTRAETENIAIDWAYINYASPIGTFDVGYMNDGETGTIFGNSYNPAGRIKYAYTIGPATLKASYTKVSEQSYNYAATATTAMDVDNDKWGVEGVYAWKDGKAGVQVAYYRYASTKPPANNYIKTYFLFTPYAIAKIGPVALQAEFNYATGKSREYDSNIAATDVTLENMSGWIDATADFGKVYFGGTFAYVSGNDPGTADKEEGGTLNGGRDWNPTLIMFNYDRFYWVGSLAGYNTISDVGTMSNAWFFQGKIGGRPLAALDIMASVSYANADKKPQDVKNNAYGWEFDLTGTYKITNNLSYMLGAGYLWTGDYFQGTNDQQGLNNNYMLINKLTLTF